MAFPATLPSPQNTRLDSHEAGCVRSTKGHPASCTSSPQLNSNLQRCIPPSVTFRPLFIPFPYFFLKAIQYKNLHLKTAYLSVGSVSSAAKLPLVSWSALKNKSIITIYHEVTIPPAMNKNMSEQDEQQFVQAPPIQKLSEEPGSLFSLMLSFAAVLTPPLARMATRSSKARNRCRTCRLISERCFTRLLFLQTV